MFYKYLISGNIENIAEIDYSEFLENIKQTGTYKNSGNIKLSLEDPNIEDANLKQIINQLSIKYNYQISEDNKDKYVEIKANYDNNEIINLEVAKNNLLVGIREEDFIDKYITLDLGSSKETLNKFNIDSKNALNISQTLFKSRNFAATHTVSETQKMVEDAIEVAPGLRLEYFEIVDGNTLQKINNWEDTSYAVGCITVFCGEVRLIDNIKYKE